MRPTKLAQVITFCDNEVMKMTDKFYVEWNCPRCGLVYIFTDNPADAKCPVCGTPLEATALHKTKDIIL